MLHPRAALAVSGVPLMAPSKKGRMKFTSSELRTRTFAAEGEGREGSPLSRSLLLLRKRSSFSSGVTVGLEDRLDLWAHHAGMTGSRQTSRSQACPASPARRLNKAEAKRQTMWV